MSNTNLNNAKQFIKDEFYTRLVDIERELSQYDTNIFKNKIVYCNCDDPTVSQFWYYFHTNFNQLKLKQLISTHYVTKGNSYIMKCIGKKDIKIPLNNNGDFRNKENIQLLKQSDLVITNPPFSLFREYISQLIQYHKKFIVIGNKNALTYKEIFPLFKSNQLWLGYTQPKEFTTPNGTTKRVNGLTRWFTNVSITNRYQWLQTNFIYQNNKQLYPKYDNYNAIEVSKVSEIPLDYNGQMGVPITFLDKYNPEQFEIIGSFNNSNIKNKAKEGYVLSKGVHIYGRKALFNGPVVNGKALYKRIIIKRKELKK